MSDPWLIAATWFTAIATIGTIAVVWWTFKRTLPNLLSERFVRPLDMFLLHREFYRAEASILLTVRQKGVDHLLPESQAPTPEGTELNSQIKYILAHYEVLLYGIEEGLFEEKFVREMMYRRIIGHYEIFESFIKFVRDSTGYPDYSKRFEKYERKWKAEKRKTVESQNGGVQGA